MKRKTIFLPFFLIIASFAFSQKYIDKEISKRLHTTSFNLIPSTAGTIPNYWCTWIAQNFAVDNLSLVSSIGLGDHRIFADNLTEENVFHHPSWENYFPEEIKKDLYIVFDVGWDVPGGALQDKSKWILGSMDLASDKFPSFTGSPSEKIKKLNEFTRSQGWKGGGLWIAAQTEADSRKEKNITDAAVENYFRERVKWCNVAGINYWKVDYGAQGNSNQFKQMLTRVAQEEAPNLLVEHGRGSGPLNDEECPGILQIKDHFKRKLNVLV